MAVYRPSHPQATFSYLRRSLEDRTFRGLILRDVDKLPRLCVPPYELKIRRFYERAREAARDL